MSALRRARLNAEMEVKDLAEAAGVSQEQIRNIENGRATNPRAKTLAALARPLNVKPADIDPHMERTAWIGVVSGDELVIEPLCMDCGKRPARVAGRCEGCDELRAQHRADAHDQEVGEDL